MHLPTSIHGFRVSQFRAFRLLRQLTLSTAVCVLTGLAFYGGAQAQAMAMTGQFAVSPSGAATYTIPIQVPPGAGGMQPQLALSYNSQAGNGLLGMGWNLSGLSAITRCPRTMAQDGVRGGVNYDGNDRFCLDGQRLVLVAGTYGAAGSEYRTELESFSRITYNGAAFKVQSKAGLTSDYGNTPDSSIEAQGKTVVRVWVLNKMTDAVGNYLKVAYQKDNANGDFRLTRIDYAGNDNTGQGTTNAVTFDYEGRTDVVPMYQAGSVIKTMQRLSTVSTFVQSNLVKTYRLGFEPSGPQSRINEINEVSGCASTLQCVPPIKMTYGNTGINKFQSVSNDGVGGWMRGEEGVQDSFADVNGDGKADLVRIWNNNGTANAQVFLSVGDRFQVASNQDVGGWRRGIDGVRDSFVDVNGDGKADLVRLWNNNGKANAQVLLSVGDRFQVTSNEDVGGWMRGEEGVQDSFADVNGDGKADLVRIWQNGSLGAYADVRKYGGESIDFGLLMKVSSGLNTTGIQYAVRSIDPSVTSYPIRNIQGGTFVSQQLTSNAAGTTNNTTYTYGGLKAEVGTGRGMLGFGWVKAKEEATGIESYTEYRQDWPYTGLPSLSETRLTGAGAGGVLKRTQVNYACKTGSGADCQPVPTNCNLASNVATCTGISGARVFPYANSVTEQSWDLDGTTMPVTTTTTLFDKSANDALYWGDASQVVVSTTSGASSSTKQVQNEYYPSNTSNGKWISGRLKRASVTSTVTAP